MALAGTLAGACVLLVAGLLVGVVECNGGLLLNRDVGQLAHVKKPHPLVRGGVL